MGNNRSPDVTGLHVVLCDFSFGWTATKRILEKCASLKVLDHHISNESVIKKLPHDNYVFDIEKSGTVVLPHFLHLVRRIGSKLIIGV